MKKLSADFGADLLRRFGRDESGIYAILAGLCMPVFVGMIGLGSEVGLWYYNHQHMQSAADSAAVAAATAYYVQGNATGLSTQAGAATAGYGFVAGSNGVTVTVNQPPKSVSASP